MAVSGPIMTASRRRDELLRTQLNGFTRLLHRLERGDVRAVHRTRVASRRLRELTPVLQIDADTGERILRDLRRVTRTLGRVRELDVLDALLKDVRLESPRADAALAVAADRVQKARTAAHKRALKKGLERGIRRVIRRLKRVAEGLSDADRRRGRRWMWALEARVSRRAATLRKSIAHAGPVYFAERLHEVRKAIKKLRYAIELSAEASGEPARGDLRRLKQAQDLLGRLHDRQVLIQTIRDTQTSLLREPPGPSAEQSLVRELDTVLADLENDCRLLHGRYVARLQWRCCSSATGWRRVHARPRPRGTRRDAPLASAS